MSFFGGIKRKALDIFGLSSSNSQNRGHNSFFPLNYLHAYYWKNVSIDASYVNNLDNADNAHKAYYHCPGVGTVVSKLANMMSNCEVSIKDKKGKDISNQYKDAIKLLRNPNPLQTWQEFIIKLDTLRMLDGEVYVYRNTPIGFTDAVPSSLTVLPKNCVTPVFTNKLINQSKIEGIVTKYNVMINGNTIEVNQNDIICINDSFVTLNDITPNSLELRGKSRLLGLEYPIKIMMQALGSSFASIKDRGAFGVLSPKPDQAGAVRMHPDEKAKLQKQLKDNYGLDEDKNSFIISDLSVDFQAINVQIKELELRQNIEQSLMFICDRFGYSFELISRERKGIGNSNNNIDKIERQVYQNSVIPFAVIYANSLKEFIGISENHELEFSFVHIECMQENEGERAKITATNTTSFLSLYREGLVTSEELREKLGLPPEIPAGTLYTEKQDSIEQNQSA